MIDILIAMHKTTKVENDEWLFIHHAFYYVGCDKKEQTIQGFCQFFLHRNVFPEFLNWGKLYICTLYLHHYVCMLTCCHLMPTSSDVVKRKLGNPCKAGYISDLALRVFATSHEAMKLSNETKDTLPWSQDDTSRDRIYPQGSEIKPSNQDTAVIN